MGAWNRQKDTTIRQWHWLPRSRDRCLVLQVGEILGRKRKGSMDDPGSDTLPRAKSARLVDQGRAQSGCGISLTQMILLFICLFTRLKHSPILWNMYHSLSNNVLLQFWQHPLLRWPIPWISASSVCSACRFSSQQHKKRVFFVTLLKLRLTKDWCQQSIAHPQPPSSRHGCV